jgi:hypothetical protein
MIPRSCITIVRSTMYSFIFRFKGAPSLFRIFNQSRVEAGKINFILIFSKIMI